MMPAGKREHLHHLEEECESTNSPTLPSVWSMPYRTCSTSPTSAPLLGIHQYPRSALQRGADMNGPSGVKEAASCATSVTTGYTANERFATSCCGGEHLHAGGVTEAAIQAFYEAMGLVDPVEKAGWTLAQTSCPPSVLEHECCPCYFMAACGGNPWDAAARMCSYWRERINLFEVRAFEPLTLGSEVASPTGLTKDDVEILESGSLSVLPCDREGRTVIFCDFSRLSFAKVPHVRSRLRVLWYVMQAAYTSGEAQCHRMVFMFACYRPPLTGQYASAVWQFSKECRMIPSAMPISLDALHLLTLSSRTGNEGLIKFMLAATIEMAGSYVSSFMRMNHGAANRGTTDAKQADLEAKQNLVQQLRDLGFTKKGLPDWAGGLFTMEDFHVWVRRRRRIEQKLYLTEEQRSQQKRAVNRIHSREKRTRRQLELNSLKAQVEVLELKNQQARNIHEHLETLLEEANIVVDGWNNGNLTAICEDHDPLPLASGDWTFEPQPVPGDSADSLPAELHSPLEPDPISPYCIPTDAKPDLPSSFASWTDAVGSNLEVPIAANDTSVVPPSLHRHLEKHGEGQEPYNMDTKDFPLSPDPLGGLLNSPVTLGPATLETLPLHSCTADPSSNAYTGYVPERIDAHWETSAYVQLQLTAPEKRIMLPPPPLLRDSSSQVHPVQSTNLRTSQPVLDDALRLQHTEGVQLAPFFHPDGQLEMNCTDLRRTVTLATPLNATSGPSQDVKQPQTLHNSGKHRSGISYPPPDECDYY